VKPAWLKLNEQWQQEGNFALTIPFLVGALRQFPGHPLRSNADGRDQLKALLESIRDDAPEGTIMRLYSCDKLKDLALAPVFGIPHYCVPVPSKQRSEPALYVEKSVLAESPGSLATLVDILWNRYREDIEAGRFSRRAGAYHGFDPNDQRIIQAAMHRADDV
jgi:hypothetical protein